MNSSFHNAEDNTQASKVFNQSYSPRKRKLSLLEAMFLILKSGQRLIVFNYTLLTDAAHNFALRLALSYNAFITVAQLIVFCSIFLCKLMIFTMMARNKAEFPQTQGCGFDSYLMLAAISPAQCLCLL